MKDNLLTLIYLSLKKFLNKVKNKLRRGSGNLWFPELN
jgi:hypothetical protein